MATAISGRSVTVEVIVREASTEKYMPGEIVGRYEISGDIAVLDIEALGRVVASTVNTFAAAEVPAAEVVS